MAGKRKPETAPEQPPVRPEVEERGEIALTLDGARLVLRPSFEAIESFEEATAKGLIQLTREAMEGSLRVGEAAHIVTACVRAWGRATGDRSAQGVNVARVAELILESMGGYASTLRTVGGMLAMAATGGYTASGEVKAGMTTTSEVPAAS